MDASSALFSLGSVAWADTLRALDEVRYLEDLLDESLDEQHRVGLRGMSDEDLVRLGHRLVGLPASALALVLTLTLVSHPVLFAYISAALLSWQARAATLKQLRLL